MSDINNMYNKLHHHLSDLHAFDTAARQGSLTKAAKLLRLTQPALSQKIKRLETYMGEPLFHRQNRGITLTRAGQLLHATSRENFNDLLQVFHSIENEKTTTRVRISTDFAFASHWLLPRLPLLRDQFRDLDIQVFTSQTPSDALAKDPAQVTILSSDIESDLVIALTTPPESTPTNQILFAEEVLAVCSPVFLEKYGPITSPHDLLKLPLLNLSAAPEAPWYNWDSWFQSQDILGPKTHAPTSLSNYALVLQAALDHQGVALGWYGLIDKFLESGQLVPACPGTVKSNRAYILYRRKATSSNVEAVFNWITKQ
ncbi:LysR family transcriptional regulator [Kiloniella laminariae]|nr:LysR family transcriptional regulator [Kiloniella laminariae]